MRCTHVSSVLCAVVVSLTLWANPAHAGPPKALLDRVHTNFQRVPVQHQRLLSSGLNRVLQLDEALNDPHTKFGDPGPTPLPPKGPGAAAAIAAVTSSFAAGAGPGGTTRVSDPRLDFVNSIMSGFTQSETSSAWCGNTIVAGYNDSGAFARTAGVNFNSAWSFSSASYSTDNGRTFTDIGQMNPGTDPVNFIAGDPVVACTSPTRFYYSSIFASFQDAAGNALNGVAVNISDDGGKTWGSPIAALAKDLNHGIDKPWMAADPTDARKLYITYTDFDFSGFFGDPSAACPDDIRYAIELVRSTDSGATWSAPVVVHQECYFAGGNNGVQGSNPIVGPDGTLYVGYEFFPAALPTNDIRVARSNDHGATFVSDVTAATLTPTGNFGTLQGGFRTNEFPMLAVDRTAGRSRGALYVTYADGRTHFADLPLIIGDYNYPDTMVTKSTDGARTFATPVAVSPTPRGFAGPGRDQFFPGIAVDGSGKVGVCYYDRRQNPTNDLIDRYCSTSENGGRTWDEERVSRASWFPAHNTDGVINTVYIGDYDSLSSDFLLRSRGFFGTFEVQTNGNPDVVGASVR
jgi:hypothetical protein